MKSVAPKKHLGQHFLTAPDIAQKIADTLKFDTFKRVLEIGPGTGVLTQLAPLSSPSTLIFCARH